MCNSTKPLLITILISLSTYCFSQNRIKESDVKVIEETYQSCLDKGSNMLGCSIDFYKDLDSCLNVAYQQLKESLDEPSKVALKKEQIDWLKSRNLKFQKIDRGIKEEGQDGAMFRQHEKANLVRDRLMTLIKRIK